jgi:hypothetical protein
MCQAEKDYRKICCDIAAKLGLQERTAPRPRGELRKLEQVGLDECKTSRCRNTSSQQSHITCPTSLSYGHI